MHSDAEKYFGNHPMFPSSVLSGAGLMRAPLSVCCDTGGGTESLGAREPAGVSGPHVPHSGFCPHLLRSVHPTGSGRTFVTWEEGKSPLPCSCFKSSDFRAGSRTSLCYIGATCRPSPVARTAVTSSSRNQGPPASCLWSSPPAALAWGWIPDPSNCPGLLLGCHLYPNDRP